MMRAVWPAPRDLVVTLVASLAMAAALLPLRGLPPGAVTLALQVVVGTVIYAGFVFAFDLAGLRAVALAHLPGWRARDTYRATAAEDHAAHL